MDMKYLFYFLLITIQFGLLNGCNIEKRPSGNFENYNEIKINPERNKTLKLSSFANDIEYLKLETTDQCLISRIDKYDKHKNLIFLFDSESRALFVFDKAGKFKYKISKKGKGPGELVFMTTFFIDKHSDRIEIWDQGKQAIIVYDINGRYIDEVKLENLNIVNFEKTPSGDYFVYNGPRETIYSKSKDLHSVFLFDSNFKLKSSYLPIFEPTLHWPPTMPPKYLSRTDGSLILVPFLRNIVYSFNLDSHNFKPKYFINFGQYNLPDKIIEEHNPNSRKRASSEKSYVDFMFNYLPKSPYAKEISTFYESKSYIYFTYDFSKMCHALYSKKSKTTITGSRVINDIDEGIAFDPPIGILGLNNDMIFGFLSPNELIKKTNNSKTVNNKLQSLINSLTPLDNPIIYYITLKPF